MSHVLSDDEAMELIGVGVSPRDIVRLAFPDADDDLADFILWEQTAFPLVSGVHDLADSMAYLMERGPRCDMPTRDGMCARRVTSWLASCWQHGADS